MTRQIFITTASWENRFIEGAKRVLHEKKPAFVLCYWFQEFGDRTAQARSQLEQIADGRDVRFVSLPMYSSQRSAEGREVPSYVNVWKTIRRTIDECRGQFESFVLDITTMPRESLWIILDLLTDMEVPGEIVYHRAEGHGDWCGSEPEHPHIVPKLGGLPSLEWPSKLLIVSGYDEDRSEQFIASYEPNETLILFQEFSEGFHPENKEKNERKHRLRLGDRGKGISFKGVNCYQEDWGFEQILTAASEFAQNANLIMASLGPKTCAVSLYRVHRHLRESSLIYAACKNYNKDYSLGISTTLSLSWDPSNLFAKAESVAKDS